MMYNNTEYMQYFETYRWQIKNLTAKESELRKLKADTDEGIASIDLIDTDRVSHIRSEIENIRSKLKFTDKLVTAIPETQELLPCKIFLRLHYIYGYSITDTAIEMNVSLSTIRRIKARCERYFSLLPPLKSGSL